MASQPDAQELPGSVDGNRLGAELSLHVIMFHEAIAHHLGVSNSEHKMLDLVAAHSPAGVTPGELAQTTGLSKAAVTKIIDKLVRAGYVQRERSPEDGRSVRVLVTEHFRRVARPTAAGVARRIEKLNHDFTADELITISRWLDGVIGALRVETAALERRPTRQQD